MTRTPSRRPYHVHVAERLAWFETADAVPRYERGQGGGAADTARPAPFLTTSCAGYAALLAGAALSTITGVSNHVISGAPPKSFATCSRHSAL